MPPDDLSRLLRRLQNEAAQILVEPHASREDAEFRVRFQLGYQACQAVLLEEVDG